MVEHIGIRVVEEDGARAQDNTVSEMVHVMVVAPSFSLKDIELM